MANIARRVILMRSIKGKVMEVSLDLEDANYRLLQLTPKLQESLEKGELSIRSFGEDSVHLCTADTTHLLRKLKQSNTLMLLKPVENSIQAYASPFESLETIQIDGKVDWSKFSVFNLADKVKFVPLNQKEHQKFAACSFAELQVQCKQKPAVASESQIYVIEPDMVHEVLVQLVSAMIEQGDFDLTKLPNTSELGGEFPPDIIEVCYRMFTSDSDADGAVDKEKLSRWIGLYLLQQHPNGVEIEKFKREWSLDLPAKLPIDIELLQGSVTFPTSNTIRFINAEALPNDINARLDSLFTIKPEWPMPEIQPFILPLMPVGQRVENWILKFAKKRKVGKTYIVSKLKR